jgi:hypothetical protein
LPTQMAKGVIVRILPFVAIPHHQASGSMNYGIIHAMYYGFIVPSMCWRSSPCLPIKETCL